MLLRLLRFLFSLIFFIVLVILTALVVVSAQLPRVDQILSIPWQVPMRVYTADHQLIAEFGDKNRTPVAIEQVPTWVTQAVVATEDQRFYSHHGIDPVGLSRAALAVIQHKSKTQGASTITMQVARNYYLSREKTYWRKIREILLALKLDHSLKKSQIMELYLNKIFFGHRSYGIVAAAHSYYGKSIQELTLPEIAMIAGLPQAPSRNNPLTNPVMAIKRRNHVLSRMHEMHFISTEDYLMAIATPDDASRHYTPITVQAPAVAEMVRLAMVDAFGEQAYQLGLEVTTTIDSRLQTEAVRAAKKGITAYSKRHPQPMKVDHDASSATDLAELFAGVTTEVMPPYHLCLVTYVEDDSVHLVVNTPEYPQATVTDDSGQWTSGDIAYCLGDAPNSMTLTRWPDIQLALLALDPQAGAIKALVGSSPYLRSDFNTVTQAWRQPGSVFKPFIYATALEHGYSLATVINDAPLVQSNGALEGKWRPHNDNQTFMGPTTLRHALLRSVNLVAIRLLQQLGWPQVMTQLEAFGFDTQMLPHTLSLAIGSGEVRPWDITAAYASFSNQGLGIHPYFIKDIKLQGKTFTPEHWHHLGGKMTPLLMQAVWQPRQRVISEETSFLMNDVLRDNIQHGTGRRAKSLHRTDIAGKTGTTNHQVDGWFIGYQHDLLTTVWMGYNDNRSIKEYGSQCALPIWIDFMSQALGDIAPQPTPPASMISMAIDPATGQRSEDPALSKEWFADYQLLLSNPHSPLLSHGSSHDEQLEAIWHE